VTTVDCLSAERVVIRGQARWDNARLLRLIRQAGFSQNQAADLAEAYRSGKCIVWVAEAGQEMIGFVAYAHAPMGGMDAQGSIVHRWVHWLRSNLTAHPLTLDLLGIVVAPEWQRRGIGESLLATLTELLRRREDRIRAVAPEGNLPVQLLLREAGFRAIRVLRDYFGDEDGYLMERRK